MKTKNILNDVVCVNDFGSEVYCCQYTSKFVSSDESIFIGPCIPQLNGTYVCSPDAHSSFKASKRLFDEMEANCNTCANLTRHKGVNRGGIMRGKCHIGERVFHPEDNMSMECWVKR